MAFSGTVFAQSGNQAEGEDFDIYVDYGGFAFQDGKNPTSFIALYTPEGALNSSSNEFYVGPQGGGMFEFVSNETFTLQFLMSVAANIQGDQGQGVRGISHNTAGLSDEYPVDAGDTVTIYWSSSINYPYALPIISFWGMVAGGLLGCVFLGAGLKKREIKLMWPAIVCLFAAFIFYLIFTNL